MLSLRSNKGGGQGILAGIAVICIAFGLYFVFKQTRSKDDSLFGDVYFYCTSCEKEFAGSSSATPPIKCPFCHEVAAVRARKYKCKECDTVFMGYLQKYDPETKLLIERRKKGESVPDAQIGSILVSAPGEDDWFEASSPEGIDLMNNVVCPKCEGIDLEVVFPPKKEK